MKRKGDGIVSTKELTKTASAQKKNSNPYSLGNALKNGGPIVWLSCLLFGLGNIMAGQVIKGLLYMAIEIGVIIFLVIPEGGIHWLSMMPSLGWLEQGKVWNDAEGIYEYSAGHQSQLILLYGVATCLILGVFALLWFWSVRGGYKALCMKKAGKHVNTFKEDVSALFDGNIHTFLMTPPIVALAIFTVTPLIYMMAMAFTNYSKVDNHLVLFDWVGVKNFADMLNAGSSIGREFWSVLSWTLIWAFFATFLNFIFGTIVAIIINRPGTKIKSFWRTCLCVTIAVPQFVSLLTMRTMLQDQGIVNTLLRDWGFIAQSDALPFFTNTTWARCTVIIINLWVGIPYTIMQVTGILKNIPADLYEAARIDGANTFQQFRSITLPYMIFVMTPQIISSFTGNINNFNVIFLLSGGAPQSIENTAGSTDLLVTWLYKLSVDQQKYNLAAVIGILTFIILAVVSLVTYRSSGSYKNEEGFN